MPLADGRRCEEAVNQQPEPEAAVLLGSRLVVGSGNGFGLLLDNRSFDSSSLFFISATDTVPYFAKSHYDCCHCRCFTPKPVTGKKHCAKVLLNV
jgi:hypothetical protein